MAHRRGFTIIEILVAIVILAILATGVARFSAVFSKALSNSSVRVVASGVATDRLQVIRTDPRYSSLVALYNSGAGADTTGFPDYPNMHRLSYVVRDQSGSPARDRTTITVKVMDPSMPDTIAVTSIIASP
jgi:prepilin-type N-terminal cleavage/methylation domain-containing protein